MKTEVALTYETLKKTYPLRRKYPEGYDSRLATFGNGLGWDPSSGHWNVSLRDLNFGRFYVTCSPLCDLHLV